MLDTSSPRFDEFLARRAHHRHNRRPGADLDFALRLEAVSCAERGAPWRRCIEVGETAFAVAGLEGNVNQRAYDSLALMFGHDADERQESVRPLWVKCLQLPERLVHFSANQFLYRVFDDGPHRFLVRMDVRRQP